MDPNKKKTYDSSLPFDDTFPKMSDLKTDAAFFEEYGKVFVRNAKFSNNSPVPNLGNERTPIEEVWKFYKFWD